MWMRRGGTKVESELELVEGAGLEKVKARDLEMALARESERWLARDFETVMQIFGDSVERIGDG